jgi:hypothetical protein
VDDRNIADDVRMGIVDGRRAMRRPAGMGDAGGAGERAVVQDPGEIAELALRPAPVDPAAIQGGDAGRVIAAIFEPFQPVEQPLGDVFPADNANDSAHLFLLLPC